MNWEELVGKTILSVDMNFGSNVVKLMIADENDLEELVIDVEPIGHGLYTPVLNQVSDYEPKITTN